MSRFVCICGEVTIEAEEPPGSSLVAHTFEEQQRVIDRITELIASHATMPSADDIEVIVTRELLESFHSLFRCPHCGRIAVHAPGAEEWEFFAKE